VESLLVSIRQVAAAISNCEFWLGVRPPNLPFPWGVRDPTWHNVYGPHKCTCQMASKSSRTVQAGCTTVTDDIQTDHATEKCVAIDGIAWSRAIPRKNNKKNGNCRRCSWRTAWWRSKSGGLLFIETGKPEVFYTPSGLIARNFRTTPTRLPLLITPSPITRRECWMFSGVFNEGQPDMLHTFACWNIKMYVSVCRNVGFSFWGTPWRPFFKF